MKPVTRSLKCCLMLITMLLILTSCQSPSMFKKEQEKQLSGRLKVVLTASETNTRYLTENPIKDKISQFMDIHPNVQVDVELQRSIDISTSKPVDYRIMYGGEVPFPDIIELTPNQIKLAMMDHLENLSIYFDSDFHNEWQGAYRELINAASVYDNHYLLPVSSSSTMIYYDAALFEAYGFLDPQEGWTWQQFVEIATALKRDGHGVAFPLTLSVLEPFVLGLGGIYSSDNLQFNGYLNSEATIDAFQTLFDTGLLEQQSIFDKNGIYRLGVTRLSLEYGGLRRQLLKSDRMAIAPLPVFDHGDNKLPSAITGLAITKESPNKELAWELLKFIGGPTDDDALALAAYYSHFSSDDGFVLKPTARDSLVLEQLIHDMSRASINTFAMTTNTPRYEGYSGGVSTSTEGWRIFEKWLSDANTEEMLNAITDLVERQMATLY